MIKNTLLIVSTVIAGGLIFGSACTSHGTPANLTAASSQSELIDQITLALNAAPIMGEINKTPQEEPGSLWNSELFNADRFKLDLKLTDRERREAKSLVSSFESHMEASSLFMYHLLSELKERNLPLELAALPLVESGFNPRAKSHAGAHGPWQFIRSTGKSLGLTRTANYDEFYDFIESTDASLRYLEHLYKECGRNWDLAAAAYNQGEFAVKKAIRAAKARGVADKDLNMDTVHLSAGANSYVRRFHAYAELLRNPQDFGAKRPEIENRPAFKRVQIAGRISSMQQAAKLSGANLSVLKHLNAGYLSDSLKSDKQRGLLVPTENAKRLERAIGIEQTPPELSSLSAQN